MARSQHGSPVLWTLLWACCLTIVQSTCPPDPPGYTFVVKMDSSNGDMTCIRDRDPKSWTVAQQAAACTAEPKCQGFNVNHLGSCLKSKLGKMHALDLRLLNMSTASPCPGMYAKQGIQWCAFPHGSIFSCSLGGMFAVDHGTARLFPSSRVYQSWGAPPPSRTNVKGGGCTHPLLPIHGCKQGPFMTFRDHTPNVYARGSIEQVLSNHTPLVPAFLPHANMHHPRSTLDHMRATTPEACEQACLDRAPKCAMYEVGMSRQYRGQCWLKSAVAEAPVVFSGVIAYVPNPGRFAGITATFNASGLPDRTLSGLFYRVEDVHFHGSNLELHHATPGACEVACVSTPGCAMFEVGTADVYLGRCWLKSSIPTHVVTYLGMAAYVPMAACDTVVLPPPLSLTLRELPESVGGPPNTTLPTTVMANTTATTAGTAAAPVAGTGTATPAGGTASGDPSQSASAAVKADTSKGHFTLNLDMRNVTNPNARWTPMQGMHYPGHNIQLLRNVPPDLCRAACLLTSGCVMYETGTPERLSDHCWLKSGVPDKVVPTPGIVAYVPT